MNLIRRIIRAWKKESPYISAFVYVVGLTAIIASAVILLHELGHVALGAMKGCENIGVVAFDSGPAATYAQMQCGSPPDAVAIFFSSFLFVAPIAALFYALRRFKERYMAHMVIGIGLVSSAADLSFVAGFSSLRWVAIGIGSVTAMYGAYRLIHGIVETEIQGRRWHTESGEKA